MNRRVPKEVNSRFYDFLELTKPRICVLALIMAALGYCLGAEVFVWSQFIAMLVGTGMVGVSCGSLNMYVERDVDAQMWRTMNRPLPAGRISEKHALVLGLVAGLVGELSLLLFVNSVTVVLGGLTILFYVGVYTPSKRVSSMSTLIGAIPGAMPPLMGWTAGHGTITAEGFLLFFMLFIWQIPHFLAIAWIYRDDYARGGFPILSVVDEGGSYVSKQVILYSLVLLPLTLVPTLWGMAGQYYFFGAMILGLVFVALGVQMAIRRVHESARVLFLYSVIYLPAISVLMVWDRVF